MKTKTEPDERAFPANVGMMYPGLTKREFIASQAAAGLAPVYGNPDTVAKIAVEIADALIKNLNKER